MPFDTVGNTAFIKTDVYLQVNKSPMCQVKLKKKRALGKYELRFILSEVNFSFRDSEGAYTRLDRQCANK